MHHKTNNDELAIYAVVAIAALAIGFFLAMNFLPQLQGGGNTTISNATLQNKTGEVQIPAEKLDKLKKALEIFFGLQSKQNLTLIYKGYADNGQYLVLNFTLADGTQLPEMIVSRDLTYFYGDTRSVLKIDDLYTQAQLALAQSQQQSQPAQISKSERPTVELYIFSYCPAGVQALHSFAPVGQLFEGKADIRVRFFSDMHGSHELQQNKIQECIQQIDPAKYWAYAAKHVESTYPKCGATRDISCDKNESVKLMDQLGINSTAVMSCVEQNGDALYSADVSAANALMMSASPSLAVNGKSFGSQFDRSSEGIKALVCSAFTNPPAECNQTLSNGTITQSGSCG